LADISLFRRDLSSKDNFPDVQSAAGGKIVPRAEFYFVGGASISRA